MSGESGNLTIGFPGVGLGVEVNVIPPDAYQDALDQAPGLAEHATHRRRYPGGKRGTPPAFSVLSETRWDPASPAGPDATVYADASRWSWEVLVHEAVHAATHLAAFTEPGVWDHGETVPQLTAEIVRAVAESPLAPERAS